MFHRPVRRVQNGRTGNGNTQRKPQEYPHDAARPSQNRTSTVQWKGNTSKNPLMQKVDNSTKRLLTIETRNDQTIKRSKIALIVIIILCGKTGCDSDLDVAVFSASWLD